MLLMLTIRRYNDDATTMREGRAKTNCAERKDRRDLGGNARIENGDFDINVCDGAEDAAANTAATTRKVRRRYFRHKS
jgi:hypothetical protein